mmetsp:Transcript_55584/g.121750  ORF Transcript_55584/g.121750 Transcript_55584/m.121750 type:complete len:554 (-) Transcript_55584:150-1811(-)
MSKLVAVIALAAADVKVQLPLGVLNGVEDGAGVERFAGIPYAEPPVEQLRFQPPKPWTTPWGEWNATGFRSPCIQNPAGDPSEVPDPEAPPPTENCLFLNIWRPRNIPKPLPVLVWIHGGGFCGGAGSSRWFNMSGLIQQEPVVGVTLNYRLGALGFLVDQGRGGMNGIRDQVVALQFVKKYISYFGGDPDRVTIFGESSGGSAVCTLSVTPEAKGLFSGAVVQSGPCLGGPPGHGWGPLPVSTGEEITQELLRGLGAKSVEELRGVPAEKIQWPSRWMTNLSVAPYFPAYFHDEELVPGGPAARYEKGLLNPDRLWVQTTTMDGTAAFYGTAPTLGFVSPDANQTDAEHWEAAMRKAWGSLAPKVMKQYNLERFQGQVQRSFVQADADAFVICPSRLVAAHAAKHIPAHLSLFAHNQRNNCDLGVDLDVTAPNATTPGWASHAADLQYSFGTEVGPNGVLGPPAPRVFCLKPAGSPERRLATMAMDHLLTFARSGSAAGPGWPRYTPEEPVLFRYSVPEDDGVEAGVVSDPAAADCAFWAQLSAEEEMEVVV